MSETNFIPISVATLVPSSAMGVDLFQRDEQNGHCILYRGADYPIHEIDLNRLRGNGIHRLFISKEARGQYQKYLRKIAEGEGYDEVSMSVRTQAMNEVVRDVLENAFFEGDTDETVSAVKQLGSITSDVVSRDEFAAHDLFNVLHHDYATFTHSANVAFYAAMLASEFGLDQKAVEQVAIGGLLHDLGKLEIDESILCKPGKLDDREFRQVKEHPTIGFRKLARRSDLSDGQLMMVYQHHERNDGRGYPVGSHSGEIHLWARICAVVDVFEALTSQRPYRTPMTRANALKLIERDAGAAFDEELVRCWKATISRGTPR